MKEYLSITELAKLRKVTSETLRYYDRIGLLKPDYIDPNNGYRYYTIRKSEKLGVIRELRDLGMSIEEILNYFNECNVQKSVKLLSKQYFKMQKNIENELILCGKIAKKLSFCGRLISIGDNMEIPYIKKYSERYIISLNKMVCGEKEYIYAFSELETMLTDISPILATDCLGVYTDERILEPSEDYIPSVPMLFVDEKEKSGNAKDYVQSVPAGYYLCIIYENGRLERYDSCFEKIKEYMRDNNLQTNGMIFQRYIIDVTMTNERKETLIEIQVPIKIKE